jgi:Putative peptidoglycan binding domain
MKKVFTARHRSPVAVLLLTVAMLCSQRFQAAYARSDADVREIQDMLVWTGDYGGIVDGVIGTGTEEAIKAFQKRINHPVSGALTTAETGRLREAGTAKKRAVGFQQVDDHVAGVSVGMPLKLLAGPVKKTWGQNWSAADDSINIDTFRYAGVTIQEVCNRLYNFRNRKIISFKVADDRCVLSGVDRDNSLVYVQALEQSPYKSGAFAEIRGFSVRLSGDAREQLRSLPAAMSSTFDLIKVGETLSTAAGPPKDLLKTPTKELKANDTSYVRSSGQCFNGLGDCPPSAAICLKDPEHCPAALPGNREQ